VTDQVAEPLPFMIRVAQRLRGRLRALGRRWHRWRFLCEARLTLPELQVGKGVSFCVPVHVTAGEGRLEIGDDVTLGVWTVPKLGDGSIAIQPRHRHSRISIGRRTLISNSVSIIAVREIRIGEGCLIGDFVRILDADHHTVDPQARHTGAGEIEAVTIGNNVMLCPRSMVLSGASIGDNSVIAAGGIVTRSIPANSFAAGIPAKVIRTL
jgi:serine acetyltransferase